MPKKIINNLLLFALIAALFRLPAAKAGEFSFEGLRNRFIGHTTGIGYVNTGDGPYKALIDSVKAAADGYLSDFRANALSGIPFGDGGLNTASLTSGQITEGYKRLAVMAKAYLNMPKTTPAEIAAAENMKNKIVSGLDIIRDNRYNISVTYVGGTTADNWWDYEIGAPAQLAVTLNLMRDEIPAADFADYIGILDYFIPDPAYRGQNPSGRETGANLLDKCYIKILEGIAAEDGGMIENAVSALTKTDEYVQTGDGFYEDGSFVQHSVSPRGYSRIAYTGGYGAGYLNDIADIFLLIDESPYNLPGNIKAGIVKKLEDAFIPVIFNGNIFDMVRGREISKYAEHDREKGMSVLSSLLTLSASVGGEAKTRLENFVLGQIDTGLFLSYASIPALKVYGEIAGRAVEPAAGGAWQFNAMARTAVKKEDFAFGLSMSSERVAYYEALNGQNPKGWYTGYGMTYFYNEDKNQYGGSFWANADKKRLPGTTVSGRDLADNYKQWTSPANKFAGGSEINGNAVSGLELSGYDGGLTAKKSWFALNDTVIALGSDINISGDSAEVQTVIDNKRLYGGSIFKVNGQAIGTDAALVRTAVTSPRNAFIANNIDGGAQNPKGIGYLFDGEINLYREVVSANGELYAVLGDTEGENPAGGGYAYSVLPSVTENELALRDSERGYAILRRDADIHAAKTDDGILAANFFTYGVKSAGYLTCDAPASVISDESAEGEIALAFCDPTQSNAGNITIELDKSAVYIAEKDAGIEVLSVMPKIKLRVQAKGDGGKVYKIRLKTGGGYNPPYIKIANLGDGDKIKSGANPFKIVVDAFTKSIEIAKVEFFANGEKIGESAAPPYSFNWPNIPAGEINLTARAVDLAGGYSEDAVKVTGGGYSYYLTDKWKAEFDNYYTTDRSVQPINWNTFDVSGNGIFTADGGALRVTQPETDGSVSGYIYPGAYGGGRRFSLSVKFEGKNVSRDIFNVKISDSLFVKFLNFRSDGNAYLSKRPSPDLLLFEYEENKWYDIVMEFNLSEKKYYLYINGEAYASNEPIPFGSGLAGIENIKFTQYSYAGVSGAMTIRSVTSATVNDGASPIRGIRLWGLKSVSGDGFARLSVNASDIDGGINRVEFYIGDNLAGTSLKPPYSYNYRGNGDVFRARAVANDGRELLSGPENVAEFSLSEAPAADADLVYAVNAFGLPPRNGDMAYGKARIQNNAPEAVTVYAYASGGKLYKSAEPAVIQPGQSDVISLDGLAFGGEYKIFLWDENQKPYCGVLK